MFSLRDWQKRAVVKLTNKRFALLKATTGSGKSVAIAKIAHDFFVSKKGTNPKVIVAVPAKGIGQNFTNIQIIEGNVNFKPRADKTLTGDMPNKSDIILTHMQENETTFENSIVICCHQSLIKAVKRNPDKFKNCIVIADEFHHCNGDEEKNELGKVVESLTVNNTNHILMVTATPYRSDGAELFPAEIASQVVKFNYSLSEYLADCKHLREIKFEEKFYHHERTFHPALKEYFSVTGIDKSIVFLPHVRLHNRRVEVGNVLAAALDLEPRDADGDLLMLEELKNPSEGNFVRLNPDDETFWLYRNNKTGRKLIVIDLDDDNEIRNHRLKWLSNNKDVDENTDVLIISLQVFIEGGDFPAIGRVINLSIDQSFLRMIQKWGRATRDFRSKTEAVFVQFMNTHEGYSLQNADAYSESKLQDIIDLQELDVDLDAVELQQIAIMRKQIYLASTKTIAPERSTDDVEIAVIPKQDVNSFWIKNWRSVFNFTLAGAAVGFLVQIIALLIK
jgi:superfamily II DNA or RNA helicase